MKPAPSGVNSVREYHQRRIERCSKRIALARKAAAAKPPQRGTRPDQAEIVADIAMGRAYQDALRTLDAIPSDISASEVARLTAEELDRVKSLLRGSTKSLAIRITTSPMQRTGRWSRAKHRLRSMSFTKPKRIDRRDNNSKRPEPRQGSSPDSD